ncbi:radical S-adenosyl methionine domain-containing protein 1, mitochondrial isoform X2 [Brienomyrus brachyistius]|uniref:radical S-adenosyl methionine domain-containing protein 1, mitochondrial isoform X2 n=1 Tax=Brienomyrus brachyistius TaxID=42636 RepID=UPI0020B1EBC6|nr:radical S-adenosyl methionine domain-containing protein 1, mitochondrial isoform X2 [Brienomyrus brachyistius]
MSVVRKSGTGLRRSLPWSGCILRNMGAGVTGRKFSASPLPSEEASLYVHWPYCLKRCSYCNFNKYISRDVNHAEMRACLQLEIETLLRVSQVSRITSVFFGGGTPSLAPPSTVAAILETVARRADLPVDAEVSLEINPTPVGLASLEEFRLSGVNRFSIGVQSLHDEALRVLGRDHNSQDALHTIAEAQRLCPGRVSVDVIFGRPGQTVESWEAELTELLSACDDHVSLYQLTLERGTRLFKQVEAGQLTMPGDDVTAHMYESARRILGKRGFLQYEVSNFARNGAVSSHNISYWKAGQYLGVGPGAHGRFIPRQEGALLREARTQTLEPDVWMKEVRCRGHGTRRRIQLGPLALLEEVLAMGLRLVEGVSHRRWKEFSPDADLHQVFGLSTEVQDLQKRGLLVLDDRGLRCSWGGLVLLDSLLPPLLLQLQAYHDHQGASG